MIALSAAQLAVSPAGAQLDRVTVRVTNNPDRPRALREREAFLVSGDDAPEGFGWYLLANSDSSLKERFGNRPAMQLPTELTYLADGDVVRLNPERRSLRVLFRKGSPHNSFLLTERCNNYCLMCSQPPRDVDDGWIIEELLEALPLIDPETREIGLTGGEPTLLGKKFVDLIQATKSYLPRTSLHVLTNGRAFAQEAFAAAVGEVAHPDLMFGVPVYSDLAHVHDYVVQAEGAFDETIRGILNLKRHRQRVEIRVVLHKQTYSRLPDLSRFIARNLLFADHVALMGLELMGFARANLDDLWIDPLDYRDELNEAVGILARAGMNVSLYNLQHCLIDRGLWSFSRRSISDWKQEYMPECEGCSVKGSCAGFFASAKYRYSDRSSPLPARWPD